ncbi:MAG: type II toxin-antitoxin system RatA family toxin [Rhodospirillaceae bacterium]|nr:type II toxin-antitoxin system RatA family toxin [Rhodospirillaceae bacterium]
MTYHHEKRLVPYRPDQLFDLVADVRKYPEFLPWCVGARVTSEEKNLVVADLMIGYKLVRERFTSRVILDKKNSSIKTEFADGPFKFLNNQWVFKENDGGCLIDFHVEFEFKSTFLQKIIVVLFNEAVERMVSAFEDRAHVLYKNITLSD